MGAIWFKRAELVGAASDPVGSKAGLALSRDDLVRHTEEIGLEDWCQGDDDGMLRVRSEEFEEAIEQLLYSVGNIAVPRVIRPEIELFHRYKTSPDDLCSLTGVLDILKSLPTKPGKPVDLTPLLVLSEKQFGADGLHLLREWTRGNAEAGAAVATVVYGELHQRAAAHIRRERKNHTLSATDLLHEIFPQLARQHVDWANRGQFYATACQMMRRALVDHARTRSAGKRGGLRVELRDDLVAVGPADLDVLALDEALTELATVDQRQAQLVELRFFAGLTLEEVAQTLDISLATANRDWRFARAWLFKRLSGTSGRQFAPKTKPPKTSRNPSSDVPSNRP